MSNWLKPEDIEGKTISRVVLGEKKIKIEFTDDSVAFFNLHLVGLAGDRIQGQFYYPSQEDDEEEF